MEPKKSPLRLKDQSLSRTNQEPEENKILPPCPSCQKPLASETAIICIHCGHKQQNAYVDDEDDSPSWIDCFKLDKEAFICLIIGFAMTLVLTSGYFPFLRGVISYFNVLVHEFGHCAFSWMMGFQSFPAFDFQHGGGVTLSFGEKPNWAIAGFIIFCVAGTAVKFYRYKLIALSLLAICAFNVVAILTNNYRPVIIYGGHATEAILGCVFLYRGLTNVSVHHVIERVLYFFLGSFLLLDQYFFSHEIMHDAHRRADYIEGKPGSLNDMVKLSDKFNISLDASLIFHLNFCIFAALFTYAVYVISMKLYTRY
ncbi:MAG: M50 family metallopeptidase [Lentisphaeraceae bacterium]|nr:M50 family metallopeptidase [Lentisphaeraceae bacterium]